MTDQKGYGSFLRMTVTAVSYRFTDPCGAGRPAIWSPPFPLVFSAAAGQYPESRQLMAGS